MCAFFLFQFWAAYVPCEAQYKDAVQQTLEQIDLIIRLTDKYSTDLRICTSADGNNLYSNGGVRVLLIMICHLFASACVPVH